MQFPCARCGRTYEIADELCVGRAVKVACPACGNLAVHRVPAPGGGTVQAPAAPPPPPQVPSVFAEADDDDFESAWSALEAPPEVEKSARPSPSAEAEPWPEPWPEPEAEPEAPNAVATPPPAVAAPPPPVAAARAAAPTPAPAGQPAAQAAPRPRPPPAPSLDDEEPVLVAAELVLRKSARRARLTAAAVALVVIGAVVGGGAFALKFKRSATLQGAGGGRRAARGEGGGSGAGLSEADLAKLMGKKDPEPTTDRPAARAQANDRPKHEKLALKDRELLDLLKKKGDASVTVQDDDVGGLATSRGSLDEQAIEGTLTRSSGSFAACVSRAIASSPDQRLPATKVNLELTIRPSGRVAKAAVQEAAIAKLPLGGCIAQAAKRMVFPGFDGDPLDIVVPLKLRVGL